MPFLGAHMSIAGGYYKAAEAAGSFGMETVQIFTKNNNQWKAKPLAEAEADRFQESLTQHNLVHPCSHASYLINLAAPDDALWSKSIDAMGVELQRAEMLGLEGVVLHPGAHTTSSVQEGIDRVIDAIGIIHRENPGLKVQTWLEATAGQGSCLGHEFEQLAEMLSRTTESERLGICIDTCHIFAAGYPLIDREDYLSTITKLDETVGLNSIRAFHLNDSKKPFGSRVDRHDHIGEGELGLEPFRHVINDERFQDLPMYLETKKEKRDGVEMDGVNLETLRGLIA